uniref:23S rRNA pseudouridine2605 synthase n=1 Tax=Candidatus Kentrum sp. TUN TaxID=2126343 RepID=A0A450ZG32_9GAMM|nr:MAG: 23S rRNA pseudouridine2605 synthase [Candidatus Kentron sp. TUN]VFK52294.1 MAG: 23S rRNA pseudouridine2605 synthase [Candidatus Kentron sp. TUN]VFK52719.1 MAG: 23S rRNA pseudouridine2605 synthase [Candidatus Kentron sp. TUN]
MPYRKSNSGKSNPKIWRKDSRKSPIQEQSASTKSKYHPPKNLPSEKLQKVLAEAGLGSRRLLESWIEAGRVSVNGVQAKLGMRVQITDKIRVDGRQIFRPPAGTKELRVLRYHKPVGEICSRADPEGRPNVFDRLPNISQGRWIAIGRLDINTCGLLLFTNTGELANRLMHPASGIEREYAVRVLPWESEMNSTQSSSYAKRSANDKKNSIPIEESITRLRKGVQLEDGIARFESIVDAGGQGRNHWYHVTIKEGKTREVRRLWEAVGLRVSRLIRVRYGPIRLERELHPARWEELSEEEITELVKCVGLSRLLETTPARSKRPRTDQRQRSIAARPTDRRNSSPPKSPPRKPNKTRR